MYSVRDRLEESKGRDYTGINFHYFDKESISSKHAKGKIKRFYT